jgi:hypothetical protein
LGTLRFRRILNAKGRKMTSYLLRNWQINRSEIVVITIILMASGWGDVTPHDFDSPPDSVLRGRETFAERYPLFWSVFGPDTAAPSEPPPDLPDCSDCLGSLLPDEGSARDVFS